MDCGGIPAIQVLISGSSLIPVVALEKENCSDHTFCRTDLDYPAWGGDDIQEAIELQINT